MNIIIRIILTILLLLWAFSPFHDSGIVNPQLELLKSAGYLNLGLICAGFLGLVAIYFRDIRIFLQLIRPEIRKMGLKAAWYMFLLPFNFIEDFFIVIHLSGSIGAGAKVNPKLASVKNFGPALGTGWSIARIPDYTGQVAGLLGLVLVVIHWIFIKKIIALLS